MRRAATVGGVVMTVAALVTASFLGAGWWTVSDDGAGPADSARRPADGRAARAEDGGDGLPGGGPELVPSTPQGLAAAVRAGLPRGELLLVRDRSDGVSGHHGPELRVDLVYRWHGRRVTLGVGATERVAEWRGVRRVCKESAGQDTCELSRVRRGLQQGRPMAVLHVAAADGAPGLDMVVIHRGDQVVFATQSGHGASRGRAVIPSAALERLLRRPEVGLRTTRALERAGAGIDLRP